MQIREKTLSGFPNIRAEVYGWRELQGITVIKLHGQGTSNSMGNFQTQGRMIELGSVGNRVKGLVGLLKINHQASFVHKIIVYLVYPYVIIYMLINLDSFKPIILYFLTKNTEASIFFMFIMFSWKKIIGLSLMLEMQCTFSKRWKWGSWEWLKWIETQRKPKSRC